MVLDHRLEEHILTVFLAGEVDHHSVRGVSLELDRLIEQYQPSVLQIDMSRVTFMDSSGIGLLMGRRRLMAASGGRVRVTGTSLLIRKVLLMSGTDRYIEIK